MSCRSCIVYLLSFESSPRAAGRAGAGRESEIRSISDSCSGFSNFIQNMKAAS